VLEIPEMREQLAIALVVVLAACAKRPPVAPPADPLAGKTSVRVLDAEVGAGVPSITDVRITPVYASDENKLPEYPDYALKAGCRTGKVPVRVFVDAAGNVSGQGDVPGRPLPGDPCLVAFRAAVQAAVAGWRFAPAFRQEPVLGPDRNGDGKPDVLRWSQSAIAIYVDFEFSFDVIGGKGVVRSQ
jgi:hypothetical protein